ncbi:MAG TPA: hypothetical protein VLJ80_11975 [Solirubrobacteraceae bacterium]|nr:hypothetical protein [Solirubrobacteraceae bacterium]
MGIPVEETLAALAPALGVILAALVVTLRAWQQRLRRPGAGLRGEAGKLRR